MLQIHVVDVQVDFLVLVNTDIFGKRVDVLKGHFLGAENEISERFQVSLLRWAPQVDVRYSEDLMVRIVILFITQFRADNGLGYLVTRIFSTLIDQ